MPNLKEAFKDILTEEELKELPTSFDIVGAILIFSDFPKRLVKKEKLIAKKLLELFPNVKTVAKKTSFHKGVYRTKKIAVIGGEKTKETTYRENGISFRLDVEKCYFSPRLSTERLRISKLVQPGEDILVMFSGVAPYPLVIAKNAKPNCVYGIEKNPIAHNYALENLRINKIKNVTLYKGDVKKVVPQLLEERKPLIGLKSYWETKQLKTRLAFKPNLIELHIKGGDLENRLKELEKNLKILKQKKIRVMLHQPDSFKGKILDPSLESSISATIECYKLLYGLCEKYKLNGFVLHPFWHLRSNLNRETFAQTFNQLKKLCKNFSKYAYLENSTGAGGIAHLQELKDVAGLENVCIDLTHVYIETKNTNKILDYIKTITAEKKYFHINDSAGSWTSSDHTREIGKGNIEFEKITPYIKYGVIEVRSRDEDKGDEELRSYTKYLKLIKDMEKFDRVIMPLPKDAETFLSLALEATKKNGVIHFYDFAHESEIPLLSINKIRKHCKAKIINVVKCGQYSPRKYRTCVDFQPLWKSPSR